MELTDADPILMPPPLRPGDKVRIVSPASPPSREWASHCARMLERWGLQVEFGEHVFDEVAWLAGTDEERLADFNTALRDPSVRALFTAAGGKGSCRIADRLDFAAARSDPKFLVGISDITALQLSLWKHCRLVSVHGSFMPDGQDSETLRKAMMTSDGICLHSRVDEPTAALTAKGRLIGGSLLPMSAVAGWALPPLVGAILLIEAVNTGPGAMDSQLTMLRKGGHLAGLVGVAVGQFNDCFHPVNGFTVVDLLRDHLEQLGVPVLGGVPVGHGYQSQTILIGAMASLDTAAGTLTVSRTEE